MVQWASLFVCMGRPSVLILPPLEAFASSFRNLADPSLLHRDFADTQILAQGDRFPFTVESPPLLTGKSSPKLDNPALFPAESLYKGIAGLSFLLFRAPASSPEKERIHLENCFLGVTSWSSTAVSGFYEDSFHLPKDEGLTGHGLLLGSLPIEALPKLRAPPPFLSSRMGVLPIDCWESSLHVYRLWPKYPPSAILIPPSAENRPDAVSLLLHSSEEARQRPPCQAPDSSNYIPNFSSSREYSCFFPPGPTFCNKMLASFSPLRVEWASGAALSTSPTLSFLTKLPFPLRF